MGQNFCQNYSGLLHFRDKLVFAFLQIQDGRLKWREKDFCENLPVDCAVTLRVKNFVEIALSSTV